ncbi:ThuA domain-containing protein [Nitrospirillum amazonense]|uniref:ThuA domain-containing protein n=1 Tax=Nitrospirillum amazonense TaxID=28077 RepID=UPI0024128D5F|nr:ThuA domain-containing protein [Nitrospirillum amazonense]MDG3443631.1 ThuA domain-containing protein [Nitrospirillum amazonense]
MNVGKALKIAALTLVATTASAQVIVTINYRPPETVQRVAIPVNPAEKRLKVLIISGQNSYEHDWTGVNNMLRTLMQDTGRFDVRVTEDFDQGTLEMLKAYDVVLLNYSSRWNYADASQHLWSDQAFKALYDYVRQGGGLVAYHSSFTWGRDIPEYRKLIGAVMTPHDSRRSPPGAFPVHIVDRTNPITQGMREYIWTYNDDMYTNMQMDPEAKIHVLATAHDSSASYAPELAGPKYPVAAYTPDKLKAMKGMDADHPQVWTADYGKGRVFSITLGHDEVSLHFAGLQTLMLRGTEWAASGAVTLPVLEEAKDFPTH